MRGYGLLCLLVMVGGCGLGPDSDFDPLTGLWRGQCCEDLFVPGRVWTLTLTEDGSGNVSGRVETTGLEGSTHPPMNFVGTVVGTSDGDSVVLEFLYEGGQREHFEGRQTYDTVFEGRLDGLGDNLVKFRRPSF